MILIKISHPADAGQRLDRFVRKYLPNAPLGGIFRMLRTGKIKVGGKKKDQTYRLELGDEISFWLTDTEMEGFVSNSDGDSFDIQSETHISPDKKTVTPLDILYEDEYLMIINKPAGINVHAGDHKTTESNIIDQVQDYLGGQYDSLTFRPALVHRIDRDTSGCLLIAKDKSVLENLLSELQAHRIEKIYHTIVLGIPQKRQDTIRERLLRVDNATNEAKVRVDPMGQSAVTHFQIIQNLSIETQDSNIQKGVAKNHIHQLNFSLLECRIETGRTHQIRVHMAYMGHPIVADRAYGDRGINSYMRLHFHLNHQLLHARILSFVHPKTQKKMRVEAPYPPHFLRLIKKDLQQMRTPDIIDQN